MPGLKAHGGTPRIIVIEQNPVLRNSIRMILEERYPLTLFDRELEALLVLDEASVELLIYGALNPLGRQVEFLRTLVTRPDRPEVILLTDGGNIDDIESFRGSLFAEVLPRTFSPMRLLHVVEEILERRAHRIDEAGPWVAGRLVERYRRELESRIIASEVREGIHYALATEVPVTICGEPGTDHETLSRIIHYLSRASTVFVKFGCRRTQADLFFSRLCETAHTRPGTIYLEEVECLAEDLVDPVSTLLTQGLLVDGRGREVSTAPRLIVSTTRDLGSLVGRGAFPEGLFQQLSVLTISIPPLRTRVEDLADLADETAKAQARRLKLTPKRFDSGAIERLQSYSWPGNLEELRSVISRTLLLCTGETVHADQIAFGFNLPAAEPVEKSRLVPEAAAESAVEENAETAPSPEMINDHSLDTILTDIVHQVRNPLVSVRTFLQLLEDKFDDTAFRRDFSRVVGGDLTRINEVMERLLTFTQISRPEPRAVDLNGLTHEVLNQYEERFEEKGISVRSRFGEGLEGVLVDPEHLRYILSSLFNDAWKSSYPEGETVVTSALIREAGESPSPDWHRFPSVAIEISFPWYPEPGDLEPQDAHFYIPVDDGDEKESLPWSLELVLCDRLIQMQEGTILVKTPERGMRSVVLLLPARRQDDPAN
ncbi:sigma 54-interacting transcriptional regulator [Thermodesulfobacteriota bacterium]